MHITWFKLRLPILTALTLAALLTNLLLAPASVIASVSINSQNLLELHNKERRTANLAPLKLNSTLSVSAQQKAQAMLDGDCWSHYCPPGVEPWQFYKEAGYAYLIAGENLAEGFVDAQSVLNAWMKSPTHRENILRGEYEEVGFGIVQGRFQGRNNNVVIAVHFGTPVRNNVNNPTSSQLPTPQILSPLNNSNFNNTNIEISGVAPEATQVNLFNNSTPIATLDANEGIFSYRTNLPEGRHTLTAQSRIGDRSAVSAPVTINIDLTADPVNVNNVVFNNITQNEVLLLINQAGYSAVALTIDGKKYNLATENSVTWQLLINAEQFLNNSSVIAEVTDLAGNQSSNALDKDILNNKLKQIRVLETQQEGQGNVLSAQLRVQGNVFFLGSMIIFFIVDYYRVNNTGLTKKVGKAHLHLAILAIALIIILAGAFSASILNGIKLF